LIFTGLPAKKPSPDVDHHNLTELREQAGHYYGFVEPN
jgi:hypothetical protein